MNQSFTHNTSKNINKNRSITALLIFAIAVIVISAYIFWPGASPPAKDVTVGGFFPGIGGAEAGNLPNMTEEAIREQMQKEADSGVFAFKINSRPIFNDGSSEGTLRIENPNHNIYPFVVKIFLDKTSEEIYDSGGIMPNHHINNATLTKVLPKGEHEATAYIYAYAPDTNIYSGKAAVELKIIIKE